MYSISTICDSMPSISPSIGRKISFGLQVDGERAGLSGWGPVLKPPGLLALGSLFQQQIHFPTLKLSEQLPHVILFHGHMQVSAGEADVGMPCGISCFGKGSAACQGMADKRMPPVVDREGA